MKANQIRVELTDIGKALHEQAKQLARTYLDTERDLIEVLSKIDDHKVYLSLGFSSLFSYTLSLGLSESQAYTLIAVTRKCRKVPELKLAIEQGQVTVSKARRIAPVIESANAEVWISKAAAMTCHKLEREVASAKPDLKIPERLVPIGPNRSKLSLAIHESLEMKLRRLQDVVSQKLQRNCSIEEALDFAISETLKRHDPIERATRSAKRKSNVASVTPKDEVVTQPVLRQVGTSSALRNEALRRDRGACQAKDSDGMVCGATRFVQVHHKIPKSIGGSDSIENLITLCSAHHKVEHSVLAMLGI